MTNEEHIKTLKAQAYDFLAMKEHAERSLGAINQQLSQLISAPAPVKKIGRPKKAISPVESTPE